MTRGASIVAMLLGVAALVGGIQGYVQAGSTASGIAGVGCGALLLVLGARGYRRHATALVPMSLIALALLARFLPLYFQHPRFWPSLVMIILACLTFGFGLLGWMLHRYQSSQTPPRP